MKIKNIVLVLIAALLVLLHQGNVDATSTGGGGASFGSDSTCLNCNGDWQSKFSFLLTNPFIWKTIVHYQVPLGIDCTATSYGLGANGDELYMVLFDFPERIELSYIYISEDEKIEIYDSDGNIITKYLSDYEPSGYGGVSNDKTFGSWIYNFIEKPYEVSYSDGFDFVVDCSDMNYEEQKQKLDEIARYLCGEKQDMPSGVTVEKKKPVIDLEPPLNVTVNGIDNNIFETKQKSLKIRWNQSNIDLTGYKTVFYMRESGRCRKTIFNEWQDIQTPWLFDKDFVTAKYCNNNLKYYEYKWWTDQSKIQTYVNALLYGDGSGGSITELSAVDFMLRNEKTDDEGILHYSNWVYVNCFDDGTYQVYEMADDYDLDKDSDETGNIKTDSEIYDDETIYDEDDVDSSLGIGDADNFLDSMQDLINSLRNFPNLFAKIFSFFPSWVLAMIGMLFIAALLARIFL